MPIRKHKADIMLSLIAILVIFTSAQILVTAVNIKLKIQEEQDECIHELISIGVERKAINRIVVDGIGSCEEKVTNYVH